MSKSFDLIVVGGGVVGCAIAEQARRVDRRGRTRRRPPELGDRRFRRIALVDSGPELGSGATWAAAGGIAPHSDDVSGDDHLAALAIRGRGLYDRWVKDLKREAHLPIPFHTRGLLRVALGFEQMAELEGKVVAGWRQHNMEHDRFTPQRMRKLVPGLSNEVVGGYYLPREACLNPRQLLAALDAVLRGDRGVELEQRVHVTGLNSRPNGIAVGLGTGEELVGDRVVVAAGLASGKLLPDLPVDPMYPVKGQIIELDVPGVDKYPFGTQLYAKVKRAEKAKKPPPSGQKFGTESTVGTDDDYHSAFLVPRHNGRVVAGVTYEDGLDDLVPTDAALDAILQGVHALLPASKNWRVLDRWCGVRPATTDWLPIIGPLPGDDRIIAATGHFGLGLTLAPATAELVCTLLTTDSPAVRATLDPFLPERFTQRNAEYPAPTAH